MLDYLELYVRLGFRLTAVHAPCASCRASPAGASACAACRGGKKPKLRHWRDGSTVSLGENVGIVCGSPSLGLVVVDFDDPADFWRVFGAAPRDVAGWTLVVRTGRGYHVYLRSAGFGPSRHVDGVLVRGEGGLVVAPPSLHATGKRYEFVQGAALMQGRVAAAADVLPASWLPLVSAPRAFSPFGATRAPARAEPAALLGVVPPTWARVEAWIGRQAPALWTHWEILRGDRPCLPPELGGRSKSDWVIALCLRQGGFPAEEAVGVLLASPGSKASERGDEYAWRTVRRAYADLARG